MRVFPGPMDPSRFLELCANLSVFPRESIFNQIVSGIEAPRRMSWSSLVCRGLHHPPSSQSGREAERHGSVDRQSVERVGVDRCLRCCPPSVSRRESKVGSTLDLRGQAQDPVSQTEDTSGGAAVRTAPTCHSPGCTEVVHSKAGFGFSYCRHRGGLVF